MKKATTNKIFVVAFLQNRKYNPFFISSKGN